MIPSRFAALAVLALLMAVAGCAAKMQPAPDAKVLTLAQLASSPDLLAALAGGQPPSENVIVRIDKGQTLPVHFNVKTPLATMNSTCSDLTFASDLYLYMAPETLMASPDGRDWTSIEDFDLLRSKFGLVNGVLNLGLSADQEHAPTLGLTLLAGPKEADPKE